ncbi:MAG: BrnT family toxin [Gemmatimonadetes bacterium]|nr:BrnT family toxin [Gemmatimonadota bacterium]MYD27992.1 BrnT family toxin [Dehalococcoidia bacterium]MYE71340.1 BrnT family toxin [Gemmatimonadota bacterium]MYI65280.1 BrnT family toxin [Gemmatimonadota bacterium]
MLWEWDASKNRANLRDHGIEFETAILVFSDPLAETVEDPYPNEQRWRTMGVVGTAAIMVVHTSPELDPESGSEVGRIISARKLTRRERRHYEEGHV